MRVHRHDQQELYLRDETGNRRFWPVKTGIIELDCLQQDRDQLFAEAVYRFRKDEQWWPDAEFERETIAAEQEARYEADVWEQPIKLFLTGKNKTTIMDIAIGALGYEPARPGMAIEKDEPQPLRGTPINRITPKDQQRITAILRHLQWEPQHNKRERWWEPKSPSGDTGDTG